MSRPVKEMRIQKWEDLELSWRIHSRRRGTVPGSGLSSLLSSVLWSPETGNPPPSTSSLVGQGLCASNILYPNSLILNPSKLVNHVSFIQLQGTFSFPTSWDRNGSLIWRYKPPMASYSFMYDLKFGQGIMQTWVWTWVLLLSTCSEHEAFVVSASLFVKWWYEHQFYRIIERIK